MPADFEPFSRDPFPESSVGELRTPFLHRAELEELLAWWDAGAREPLVVSGPPGIGKTALLQVFAHDVAQSLRDPAAVNFRSFGWIRTLSDAAVPEVEDLLSELPQDGRALMLLDEVERAPHARMVEVLEQIRARRPDVGITLASRADDAPWPPGWRRLRMNPLTDAQALEFIAQLYARIEAAPHQNELYRLIAASAGSPRALLTLAEMALRGTVDSALARFAEERFEGVFPSLDVFPSDQLFPGGASPAERELDVRVCAVNDELIRRLVQRPELMYELRPRQFEELMAELFARQGFEVELTQQTRDGGVDLYVVHHTPAGRLLTLVDAKRNARDRPVGVGVVRQLYGVVEAKRASAGLVATTSFFSPDAKRFQEELRFRLELKDYVDLQTMLRAAAGG